MSSAWIAVAIVGVATIAIKAAGPLVFADRPLPRPVAALMPLLAPALLAALVVNQTVADRRSLVLDARAAALLARAPLLVVLAAAAGVAAAARALGAA